MYVYLICKVIYCLSVVKLYIKYHGSATGTFGYVDNDKVDESRH